MNDCAICFEPIEIQGVLSSCSHEFCFDCIEKWSHQSNTCPLCKQRFDSLYKQPYKNSKSKKRTVEASNTKPSKRRRTGTVIHVPHRDIRTPPSYFAFLFTNQMRLYLARGLNAHRHESLLGSESTLGPESIIDLTTEDQDQEVTVVSTTLSRNVIIID
eukprot:TRINITY_DN611_c0_g1_i5.p1 TRINITY_DN611_c0_g1~~TRINITY_DN611_c0_g1_i5.p1  ORF type:complete len:159 (-),score=9.90 TRINITY_DN611_c0_g1_i5:263-739(-)